MKWDVFDESGAEQIHYSKIHGGVLFKFVNYAGNASSTSVVFVPNVMVRSSRDGTNMIAPSLVEGGKDRTQPQVKAPPKTKKKATK